MVVVAVGVCDVSLSGPTPPVVLPPWPLQLSRTFPLFQCDLVSLIHMRVNRIYECRIFSTIYLCK